MMLKPFKFKQLNVPAELHIYAGSGHGFGLRANDPKPAGKWIERLEEWLADSGFLKKPQSMEPHFSH